jgi:hypothetical protein
MPYHPNPIRLVRPEVGLHYMDLLDDDHDDDYDDI